MAPEPPAAPVWSPPVAQQPTPTPTPPSRPSWWVGRGPAAAEPPVEDQHDAPSNDQQPSAGDTAVVEPLIDRRPAPTPLIAPGNGPATCPVCGHTLEPDDIFCAECGAVRPTVTAAFTGPVVPLPMTRPDWAADDEVRPGDEDNDDEGDAVGAVQTDPDDELPAAAPDVDRVDVNRADDDRADDERVDGERVVRADDDRSVGERADVDRTEDDRVVATPSDAGDSGSASDRGAFPPAPASPTVPSSAHATTSDLPSVPTAAPLPPIPGATGPVLPPVGGAAVPSSGDPEPDEDVEETRIVVKTQSTAPFVLHFSTGERTAVHGTGLLGRLPRPQPAERFDDLLTVHDPGKSVSKTHLELGRDGDDLWVSDRNSGNGTVIRHIDGSIRRCEPGRRYRVERGARVDIGEQFFLVQ
ncbi:FHA domain-containing protein [Curtobacterium albidum]|uniref:FHA domain-containing protein n=1 Tax=Curtobacterium citreum TaxID=2036 RepID=UPI0020272793|nr:FHA domain-containing protein [Curtobacterium albidum]MCL9664988.1 FHA domain-containing protein [Curtobacterium albidum]